MTCDLQVQTRHEITPKTGLVSRDKMLAILTSVLFPSGQLYVAAKGKPGLPDAAKQ